MSRQPFAYVTKHGKVVSADVLERYAVKQRESRQLTETAWSYGGAEAIVQPPYDPDAMIALLEKNTYHYRACRTKARDTAGRGWRLVARPGAEERALDAEQSREELERQIMECQCPLSRTLEQAQLDFEAIGWATIELLRDEQGRVYDIQHVPAHTVRWHADGDKLVQKRGAQRVWFRLAGVEEPMDYRTGKFGEDVPEEFRASELMVWVNYTPMSDFYGVSDILPALGALAGDIARRDYNISFFDNYGVPAYAVFITGDFDPGEPDEDGFTALERSVHEHFDELKKNPHSTLILSVPSSEDGGGEVNIEVKPLATDTKDAAFRMYRQDNRDEILSAHGVDPYRVGIAETGSLGGSTSQEASIIYKESVIEPRQALIEALLNRHVVQSDIWELELIELDTTDPAGDIGLLMQLFGVGAVTPIEIAEHFADHFSLDTTVMVSPALHAHYVNGEAVDLEETTARLIELGVIDEPEPEPEPEPAPEPVPSEPDEDEMVVPADEVQEVLRTLREDVLRIAATKTRRILQ